MPATITCEYCLANEIEFIFDCYGWSNDESGAIVALCSQYPSPPLSPPSAMDSQRIVHDHMKGNCSAVLEISGMTADDLAHTYSSTSPSSHYLRPDASNAEIAFEYVASIVSVIPFTHENVID